MAAAQTAEVSEQVLRTQQLESVWISLNWIDSLLKWTPACRVALNKARAGGDADLFQAEWDSCVDELREADGAAIEAMLNNSHDATNFLKGGVAWAYKNFDDSVQALWLEARVRQRRAELRGKSRANIFKLSPTSALPRDRATQLSLITAHGWDGLLAPCLWQREAYSADLQFLIRTWATMADTQCLATWLRPIKRAMPPHMHDGLVLAVSKRMERALDQALKLRAAGFLAEQLVPIASDDTTRSATWQRNVPVLHKHAAALCTRLVNAAAGQAVSYKYSGRVSKSSIADLFAVDPGQEEYAGPGATTVARRAAFANRVIVDRWLAQVDPARNGAIASTARQASSVSAAVASATPAPAAAPRTEASMQRQQSKPRAATAAAAAPPAVSASTAKSSKVAKSSKPSSSKSASSVPAAAQAAYSKATSTSSAAARPPPAAITTAVESAKLPPPPPPPAATATAPQTINLVELPAGLLQHGLDSARAALAATRAATAHPVGNEWVKKVLHIDQAWPVYDLVSSEDESNGSSQKAKPSIAQASGSKFQRDMMAAQATPAARSKRAAPQRATSPPAPAPAGRPRLVAPPMAAAGRGTSLLSAASARHPGVSLQRGRPVLQARPPPRGASEGSAIQQAMRHVEQQRAGRQLPTGPTWTDRVDLDAAMQRQGSPPAPHPRVSGPARGLHPHAQVVAAGPHSGTWGGPRQSVENSLELAYYRPNVEHIASAAEPAMTCLGPPPGELIATVDPTLLQPVSYSKFAERSIQMVTDRAARACKRQSSIANSRFEALLRQAGQAPPSARGMMLEQYLLEHKAQFNSTTESKESALESACLSQQMQRLRGHAGPCPEPPESTWPDQPAAAARLRAALGLRAAPSDVPAGAAPSPPPAVAPARKPSPVPRAWSFTQAPATTLVPPPLVSRPRADPRAGRARVRI